jgi:3-deoxy-D-manno-octulosonic-acid transferase
MTAFPVGRRLYTLGLWLAAPLVLLRLWMRSRRQPEYVQHLAERFGRYGPALEAGPGSSMAPALGPGREMPIDSAPLIWMHAVSVGETQATRPLIEALRLRLPHARPTRRQ